MNAVPPSLCRYAWTDELCEADLAYLEALPFTITLADHDAVVVHAGLVPGVPLHDQRWQDMTCMRDLVRTGEGQPAWAAAETPAGSSAAWASVWDGPGHVVFGHDAKRGLQQHRKATGLDTGCLYGKRLTAMVLPSKTLVAVPARKTHVVPASASKAPAAPALVRMGAAIVLLSAPLWAPVLFHACRH